MIKVSKLIHDYIQRDEDGNPSGTIRAIDDVSLDVKPGQFIAILGHNGSGKSTLAKHLNALLFPTEGAVWINGLDTRDQQYLWEIRQTAGMVFQNPDNQIIGQVVEEDVGFGPENMGVPTEEIWERVEESLKAVGMYEYRKKSPNRLSGGQKQRVSIAGVIAMEPNGRHQGGAYPEQGRGDHDHPDHPLYGRSHTGGQDLRDGQGQDRHAGLPQRDFLQSGRDAGASSGRASGHSARAHPAQQRCGYPGRDPDIRGARPGNLP